MASSLETREWQKRHLTSLLRLKKSYSNVNEDLKRELENAVVIMDQEDVAYCEKVVGVKAL